MDAHGLESLIHKKNQSSPPPAVSDEYVLDDVIDATSFIREERESLGVLGSFTIPLPDVAAPHRDRDDRDSFSAPYTVSNSDPFVAPQKSFAHDAVVPPSIPRQESREIPVLSGPIFHIELDKITINPYQPRTEFNEEALNELAVSIREFGILQPLVVSKMEEETDFGTKVSYQLIAGHRRLLASRKAGLKTVPVVVRNALKKTEALEMAIVENIQRRDLNIIETARAYARLSDEFGLTQREIAGRLGKSRESVANTLRLLSLPSAIQDALSAGTINESHARILMQVQDQGRQEALFHDITKNNLSVRDIKKKLQRPVMPAVHETVTRPSADALEFKQLERDLSEMLGAPVQVEVSANGGKIIIHFYSSEEALGIAQKMHPYPRRQEDV